MQELEKIWSWGGKAWGFIVAAYYFLKRIVLIGQELAQFVNTTTADWPGNIPLSDIFGSATEIVTLILAAIIIAAWYFGPYGKVLGWVREIVGASPIFAGILKLVVLVVGIWSLGTGVYAMLHGGLWAALIVTGVTIFVFWRERARKIGGGLWAFGKGSAELVGKAGKAGLGAGKTVLTSSTGLARLFKSNPRAAVYRDAFMEVLRYFQEERNRLPGGELNEPALVAGLELVRDQLTEEGEEDERPVIETVYNAFVAEHDATVMPVSAPTSVFKRMIFSASAWRMTAP